MQKIIENKGITLIALVISIIIMLILAGVSIGMIMGENGLFGQTKKAVKSYVTASEMETLSLSVFNYNITNNEEDKLGEKLSKKDVSNPNWHMIKDEENTYADGWYFVEQGNDLPNGSKAKNNWVINYETGEVKQLKEKYASMSIGDSVAVKEGLVLNIDTAMMDKKENWTIDEIESALGNNVKLHNFAAEDLGSKSGFNSDGFLLDGENDYISITSNTKLDDLFNKGFTFEFSGTCNGSYRDFDSVQDVGLTGECALFSINTSNFSDLSPFVICSQNNNIFAKVGGRNDLYSRWSSKNWGENMYIPCSIQQNKPITFSLVLDLSKTGNDINVKGNDYTGYKLSLYIDGKEEQSSYLNSTQWDEFKKRLRDTADTFYLGVFRNIYADNQNDKASQYGKMSLENLRFYTRPLNAEEIKLNYDTRLAYNEANN